jgi:hypothetical protein
VRAPGRGCREIALAAKDLKRAEDRLEFANRYKFSDGLGVYTISDKLAMARAKSAVEKATTKKNVLEKYTHDKTVKELETEVEKARAFELAKKAIYEIEKAAVQTLLKQGPA